MGYHLFVMKQGGLNHDLNMTEVQKQRSNLGDQEYNLSKQNHYQTWNK